jgi:hypothetical protein
MESGGATTMGRSPSPQQRRRSPSPRRQRSRSRSPRRDRARSRSRDRGRQDHDANNHGDGRDGRPSNWTDRGGDRGGGDRGGGGGDRGKRGGSPNYAPYQQNYDRAPPPPPRQGGGTHLNTGRGNAPGGPGGGFPVDDPADDQLRAQARGLFRRSTRPTKNILLLLLLRLFLLPLLSASV